MKKIFHLLILSFFSVILSLSCNAENKANKNIEIINTLITKFISPKAVLSSNNTANIKQGDFNGDGLNDFAVVFFPVTDKTTSKNIKALNLWQRPNSAIDKNLHKSLAIFHGNKNGWLSNDVRGFVLFDYTGTLESPSFELLISHTGDKEHQNNASYMPIKIKTDLIILPTEAGIDTYIYWHNGIYHLFEPEEIP